MEPIFIVRTREVGCTHAFTKRRSLVDLMCARSCWMLVLMQTLVYHGIQDGVVDCYLGKQSEKLTKAFEIS